MDGLLSQSRTPEVLHAEYQYVVEPVGAPGSGAFSLADGCPPIICLCELDIKWLPAEFRPMFRGYPLF